jgi:aryl-alcohol dehydrogenase-like predicted oxidoreductase
MAEMPSTPIAGTELVVSRFIFGTASLFNAGNAATRQALLNAAVAGGFTHFDTAPLYGFGMAERDLAPVLHAHGHLTVTTKVGLHAPGGHDSGAALITVRKAAGRVLRGLSRAIADTSLARARISLDGSLRRLGRDRIDLLLLHEPDHSHLNTDEWCRWLEDERKAGKVGAFGIAGPATCLRPFLDAPSPLLSVIQTEDSLDHREADVARQAVGVPQITYGYVSAARALNDTRPVAAILHAALAQQANGAIVVSTTRPERAAQYRDIAKGAA